MPELTLWKTEASPPANAVRVLAEILGLDLNVIEVDFFTMEHKSPEILKINPCGTVPILKVGDFVLTDSHAQLKYLVAKYGKPEHSSLYPSDIEKQAIVDQSLFLDAAIIFIRFKVVALPTCLEGMTGPTERHIQDIEAGYGIVESYIGDNKFVAADHLTIADLCLGPSIVASLPIVELDKEKFPRVAAWLDRLYDIPEFNKYISVESKILSDLLPAFWAKNSE